MKKPLIEWSVLLICEIVFAAVGTIFTASGVLLGIFIDEIAASPNSRGNVYVLPWVFGGIGIVFLLVFSVMLFVSLRQMKQRDRLIESGSCINARVTEVRQDYAVRVNLRHPYYIICEAVNPCTGENMTFRSADIMEDPSHLLGRYLRVFLDYEKPKKYYVEIYSG